MVYCVPNAALHLSENGLTNACGSIYRYVDAVSRSLAKVKSMGPVTDEAQDREDEQRRELRRKVPPFSAQPIFRSKKEKAKERFPAQEEHKRREGERAGREKRQSNELERPAPGQNPLPKHRLSPDWSSDLPVQFSARRCSQLECQQAEARAGTATNPARGLRRGHLELRGRQRWFLYRSRGSRVPVMGRWSVIVTRLSSWLRLRPVSCTTSPRAHLHNKQASQQASKQAQTNIRARAGSPTRVLQLKLVHGLVERLRGKEQRWDAAERPLKEDRLLQFEEAWAEAGVQFEAQNQGGQRGRAEVRETLAGISGHVSKHAVVAATASEQGCPNAAAETYKKVSDHR